MNRPAEQIAADAALVDGVQPVVLLSTAGSRTIPHALPGALDCQEEALVGGQLGLGAAYRTWRLLAAEVGSDGVQVGQRLQDPAGQIWRVVSARRVVLDTAWRVLCIEQRV